MRGAVKARLVLEGLEERCVPSVSPTASNEVFYRQKNGDLFINTFGAPPAQAVRVDINTVQVSGGVTTSGQYDNLAAAFIVYDNSYLYEWSDNTFHLIDVNVADVSASLVQNDTVFIRYTNGEVYEHTGKSAGTGFRFIDINAVSVTAGQDAQGNPLAYIVYNNGYLYRWSAAAGFRFIDVNVRQVSAPNLPAGLAAQPNLDTVYIVYTNNYLYEWTPNGNFRFIDVNVSQVGAGIPYTTGGGTPPSDVYIVYTDHELYAWGVTGSPGFQFVDVNVSSVSGTNVQGGAYIVYTNAQLFAWTVNGFGFQLMADNVG